MLGTITNVLLHAYELTDKGRVRPTNEDCFAVREDLGLCVVADGMGGHNAGEIAARLAVEAVIAVIENPSAGREPRLVERDAPVSAFGFDPSLSAAGNLLRSA